MRSLTIELEQCRTDLSDVGRQHSDTKQELSALQHKISKDKTSVEYKLKSCKEDLSQFKSTVKDLEKKAKVEKKKAKKVAEELARAKAEAKSIEDRLKEKWASAKELLTLKLESLGKDKALAEIMFEKCKSELTQAIELLKAEKEKHKKSKAKFTEVFRQEKASKESLVKQGSDGQADLTGLRQDMAGMRSEVKTLRSQLADACAARDDAKTKLQKQSQEAQMYKIKAAESQLEKLGTSTEGQKDQYTAQLEMDFLNKQIAKLEKQLQTASNKLQTATFENEMLEKQVATLTADNKKLKNDLAQTEPGSASAPPPTPSTAEDAVVTWARRYLATLKSTPSYTVLKAEALTLFDHARWTAQKERIAELLIAAGGDGAGVDGEGEPAAAQPKARKKPPKGSKAAKAARDGSKQVEASVVQVAEKTVNEVVDEAIASAQDVEAGEQEATQAAEPERAAAAEARAENAAAAAEAEAGKTAAQAQFMAAEAKAAAATETADPPSGTAPAEPDVWGALPVSLLEQQLDDSVLSISSICKEVVSPRRTGATTIGNVSSIGNLEKELDDLIAMVRNTGLPEGVVAAPSLAAGLPSDGAQDGGDAADETGGALDDGQRDGTERSRSPIALTSAHPVAQDAPPDAQEDLVEGAGAAPPTGKDGEADSGGVSPPPMSPPDDEDEEEEDFHGQPPADAVAIMTPTTPVADQEDAKLVVGAAAISTNVASNDDDEEEDLIGGGPPPLDDAFDDDDSGDDLFGAKPAVGAKPVVKREVPITADVKQAPAAAAIAATTDEDEDDLFGGGPPPLDDAFDEDEDDLFGAKPAASAKPARTQKVPDLAEVKQAVDAAAAIDDDDEEDDLFGGGPPPLDDAFDDDDDLFGSKPPVSTKAPAKKKATAKEITKAKAAVSNTLDNAMQVGPPDLFDDDSDDDLFG